MLFAAGIAAVAFLLSLVGTRLLIPLLRQRVLDRPNERSSHTVPTPRGGGIAVTGTVLLIWLWLTISGRLQPILLLVPAAALVLAIVSWLDDLRGLSPVARLVTQLAAVGLGMGALPSHAVFQGWLPPVLDDAAVALVWLWFVNLFNFMDGIDGIAGAETATVGLGLVLIAPAPETALLAAAIVGAAIGFLVWNWAPARIFLGDVGSVPLGFLLGFLLLDAAARGAWLPALILPAYFLADATLTLLRRLSRRERVWEAHREHFYQQAVQAGLGHAAVVSRVILADALLIGCAWAATQGWGFAALAAAAVIVIVLLADLARAR
ncbi:MAG TPA: glycosyltransferase family 4 protein [Stellaceae bacterium]|nr:glycosyltransferase family 4 protein [Stellaceae bacterium]